MLQPVRQAVPGASPVRAPPAVETVAAIHGAAEGERARNDGTRDRGAEAERLAREAKDRAADPAQPVGPPPAFQANVLEAERARLKEVEPLEAAGAGSVAETPGDGAAGPSAGETPGAAQPEAREERAAELRREARETPGPTGSDYGGVREDPPRLLDVSR